MSTTDLIKSPSLQSLMKPSVGIAGKRAAAKATLATVNPLTVKNRYAIGFDDSGSMGVQLKIDGTSDTLLNFAKTAVLNFVTQCSPLETSLALYNMDMAHTQQTPLTCDYNLFKQKVNSLSADYGTPLYHQLAQIILEPCTRAIIFSDGQPTDDINNSFIIQQVVESTIPFDTIYIGNAPNSPTLEEISRLTGGTHFKFNSIKSFTQNLKYLSPSFRALLTNPEVKAKIERGETI